MGAMNSTNAQLARESTLSALEAAAQAVKVAIESLDSKSSAVNTVALNGATLAALESINAATGGLTDAEMRAAPVPVSAASLPLPTGAATEATLSGVNDKLPALDAGRLPVVLPPGGSGLTDSELRAAPVDVHDHEAALMFLRFFNLFSSPPGYDPALQRQRGTVLVESGTVTTVSTVSLVTAITTLATLTNMAQLDGVQGRLLAYGADLSAWSDCVRSRIT